MLVLRLLQQVNGVGLPRYAVYAAWAVTLVMVTLPARAQDGCSPCPPPLMMLAQVSDVAPIDEKEYQQIYQDAAAKVLNETVDDTKFQDQGQGVFWRNSFAQPKTRYIRFRFDHIMSPQGLRYRVRILREPAEEEVASYTGDEFARDESFMTGLLPPGHLRIELVSEVRPQGLSFRLERALWQAKSTEAKPQTPVLKFKYIRTLPENSPPPDGSADGRQAPHRPSGDVLHGRAS